MPYLRIMLVVLLLACAAGFAKEPAPAPKIAAGLFSPTWDSLRKYECPEWFRDAKFGVWAHWGPQAVPGMGDWYARGMYEEGSPQNKYHVENYGHPSKVGYKDVLEQWKAEKWEPERLMALYKAAGAKYFVSMGVHHDNFDLWNSKHHSWNAVQHGPKRDMVGVWKAAAAKEGLRFGVSEHLGASYAWWTGNKGADKQGPLAGVPYDGNQTELQELYHPPHDEPWLGSDKHYTWYATNPAWQAEWFARISDLVDSYQPDLLYSDGGVPFGETGRALVSHFYNQNVAQHGGKLEAVYNCKKMGSGEFEVGTCVQDVERGGMPGIEPHPWQTDTSIGDWYYRRGESYKSTREVAQFLADIVSKNGNLLLNVVLLPDGTLPAPCEQFLTEMAAWMKLNGEAIYATRPFTVYGEGPTMVGGHFNERFNFTAKDVRYTTAKSGGQLYAIALVPTPGQKLVLPAVTPQAFAAKNVTLLGSDAKLDWSQTDTGLTCTLPAELPIADMPVALRIAK